MQNSKISSFSRKIRDLSGGFSSKITRKLSKFSFAIYKVYDSFFRIESAILFEF